MSRLSIEEKIINILKKYQWGLTAKEISEKIGISRITVSKYLAQLKASGILSERKVGAYRVWYIKNLAEKARKILPKRIISSIGRAFLRVFGDQAYTIAENVGSAIIDEVYDLIAPLKESSEENVFTTVADLVSMLSEGVKAEAIKLRDGRGIFRVYVEDHVLDSDIIKLLASLFKGAIVGIFKRIIIKSVQCKEPIINQVRDGFEIILEVEIL